MPLITDLAYCQYEFLGELFTTESVEQNTRSPVFQYRHIHHVPVVTPEFVQYLQTHRLEFQIFINPFVMNPPMDIISTSNEDIRRHLGGHVSSTSTINRMLCCPSYLIFNNAIEYLKRRMVVVVVIRTRDISCYTISTCTSFFC